VCRVQCVILGSESGDVYEFGGRVAGESGGELGGKFRALLGCYEMLICCSG
jgi:hypothetical protein